jgi:hypothetical protein
MSQSREERRTSRERRVVERRRTMRYNVRTLLIIDGITWIDGEGNERRRAIRRRADREALAAAFLRRSKG